MRLRGAGFAALLASLASGAAGATETRGALYGDLRFSLDYAEDNPGTPGPTYNFTDNNSVWGVKASTSRGGVTVFGAYERFIEGDEAALPGDVVTREAFLGVRSFCGTIKAGRHTTAYADAGRKLDPFFNTTVAGTSGVASGTDLFGGGNSHGSSTLFNADYFGNAFVADHVSYESPAFMGITANAAIFMDETNDADQNHSYGAGAEFRGGGLTAGAQFIDSNAHWGLDVEAARLYLGYAQDRFGLGASVEKIDHPSPVANTNYLMLSGWYGLRTDTRLAFSYGLEDDSGAEGDSLRAGIFHDVLENFTVWAAARRYNERATPVEADVFTLGASYKFSLGFSS
jgi:hypothetical protein